MAVVLVNPPNWMQNRKYSARLDRTFTDVLFGEGVLDLGAGQFAVTQNALGLDNSVDVAAGLAVVEGDDEVNQGKYVVRLELAQNVPFGPAPTADERIDLLVLRVNDAQAGSSATPADQAVLDIIQGTVSSSPVAPALPDTAIPLAQVLRTNGDTSITNAMITDLRQVAAPLLEVLRISEQTASYTLVGIDAGQVVEMNSAGANTVTIPTNADVPFPVGVTILVVQTGTGQTTIAGDSGVTVNAAGGFLNLTARWSSATLLKRDTNSWVVVGDLS
jgi:hypothetical protein